jgi:hypothetical protein
MNCQRRVSNDQLAFLDSTSKQLPLPVRSRFENAVPSGTVASRVRHLQKLGNSTQSSTLRAPPSSSSHRREESRSGFGRRISNRFARPASRNTYPTEQSQVSPHHSFLGLNATRKNHEEEHAVAGRPSISARTPRLDGLINQQGLSRRSTYADVSPGSVQPHPKHDHIGDSDACREEIRPPLEDSIISDISAMTTSTDRRQSTRYMFNRYGIERPHGLLSEESVQGEEDTPAICKPHKYCHVCSWINNGSAKTCRRCDHRFCKDCHARNEPDDTGGHPNSEIKSSKPQPELLRNQENLPAEFEDKHNRVIRKEPTAQEKVQTNGPEARKPSSPIHEFFSCHPEISVSPKSSVQPDQAMSTKNPQPSAGSQTTTHVKDSPSFRAYHPSGAPAADFATVEADHKKHSQRKRHWKHHRHASSDSNPSLLDAGERKSLACLSTHYKQRQYHHTTLSSRKKRRLPTAETDNGYIADGSRIEDLANLHLQYYTGSLRPQDSLHHASKESGWTGKFLLGDCPVPEYVECKGYPRTGHARHGSPVTSGIIGQCQHCIYDCQCKACQTTHHNVRCCTHEDHDALIHHHQHTQELSSTAPQPQECPKSAPGRSPRTSYSSSSCTIVPPWHHGMPPVLESPEPKTPKPSSPKKPNLKKSRLPVSKASPHRELKEKPAQPLKPSPSRNSPQDRGMMANAMTTPFLASKRTTTDTTSFTKTVAHPPPQSNEQPNVPPSLMCNGSSPQTNSMPTDGTWTTTFSDPPRKQQHKDNGRECFTFPSRKKSSTERRSGRNSVGTESKAQWIPPPGSRKVSQLAAMFQSNEATKSRASNQKLLDCQEKLKPITMKCDEKSDTMSRDGEQSAKSDPTKRKSTSPVDRATSVGKNNAGSAKKGKWHLKLIDRTPSPACPNDGIKKIQQHILSVDEEIKEQARPDRNVPVPWTDQFEKKEDEHKCIWKNKFVAGVLGGVDHMGDANMETGLGLLGVTVIIHLDGGKDLVMRADMKNGGEDRQWRVEKG